MIGLTPIEWYNPITSPVEPNVVVRPLLDLERIAGANARVVDFRAADQG